MANQKSQLFLFGIIFGLLFILVLGVLFFFETQKSASLEKNIVRLDQTLEDKNQQISALSYQRNQLNQSLLRTAQTLNSTELELELTRANLSEVSDALFASQNQLNHSKQILSQLKNNISVLRSEVIAIDKNLNDSIQWFKVNSVLPSSYSSFTGEVLGGCFEGNVLNLGCASFVMSRSLNFNYRTEAIDRLYSLEELRTRQGGDCEDFSLFLKALITSIKSVRNFEIAAWRADPAGAEKYTIFKDGNQYWYYSGTGVILGNSDSLFPYMVCFNTNYDAVSRGYQGHCIVALASSDIKSSDGMALLRNAQLFEPQNGQYLGRVGTDLYLCVNGNRNCERQLNTIYFVTSNSDSYQFSEGQWKGYEDGHVQTTEFFQTLDKLSNLD
ncbi:hypothetical protein HY990_01835 [Candidatus Micrarchaeota archaeon]|nr:hypothetical protein [Candidatus Micrarchaeota archaeon]